ncbi:MAG TPA: hypothetical protein DCG57_01020 [Candidatus Riflebacteria bacterium]|jgi:uncharacterized membrane protein|nr:hypothetical protein [Candidatus Riflebacteria bacterium]
MIESGFAYVAVLLFMAAVIVQLDKKFRKFFDYVPGIVVLYFAVMTFSTLGLWKQTDEINFYYTQLKNNVLPVMIFLMLLHCDLKKIVRLGPRMLLGFFSASLTIGAGFVVTYFLFKSHFEPHTWKTFAALSGSWMGGTGNMAAIQLALGVSDSQMGYTLMMDSVNYAVWVMLLLAVVPYAKHFNHWTKADTSQIDEVGASLMADHGDRPQNMSFSDLILLLGSAFAVAALAQYVAPMLPTSAFVSTYSWTVILTTLAGIIAALTPLGKVAGISPLASLMLYLIVALIGSRANFAELTQAPFYIFCGFVILLVHALLLALIAKLFKLDLFTCGVASLANVGGVASAPILAAAYSEVLVPIGVLMGMLGYIVGTGGGLLVGKILSMI